MFYMLKPEMEFSQEPNEGIDKQQSQIRLRSHANSNQQMRWYNRTVFELNRVVYMHFKRVLLYNRR